MSEILRILDQLDRAFEGDAWHGSSVRKLLEEVPAKLAAAKPVPGGHSIWEIVRHMATWQNVVRRRLGGETIGDLPPELDWPSVPDKSETALGPSRRGSNPIETETAQGHYSIGRQSAR